VKPAPRIGEPVDEHSEDAGRQRGVGRTGDPGERHLRRRRLVDREAAAERVPAIEEVERRLGLGLSGAQIALGHRELVEIGEQRERQPVDLGQQAHAAIMRQVGPDAYGRRAAEADRRGPASAVPAAPDMLRSRLR